MSLSSVSIRRPVLATVMSILIVLFGIIGLFQLGVREFPSVDPPIVTVSTSYIGANADIIESQITEPIEESVNRVAGIRSLTSVSRDGRSTVTVEFDLDVDLEAAANDVRDKVSQSVGELPPDADPPVVSKADANSFPIIFLNIKSDTRSLLELTAIAENVFKERFQTIQGVSDVQVWGSKRYAMRLWMDPERLAAYQLTPLDVRNALRRENVELPSGRIEGDATELTVRTMGRLTTPKEFNELIIKENGGSKVRFQDIGRAELGPENLRTVLKRDGIPMVGNALVAQPGSNNIAIADAFYERLEQIKKDLPPDIETAIGFDMTTYVRDSIEEVQQTILIAFALVTLIIFLFLRDWRTTFIPVIVIPISLIGSFFIMWAAGFTINVLTLLGVVLAIGLVVDDAVVVLENIYAKIEQGMDPQDAALKGSAEIFFAVIATTVALAAVFLPVIFLQGLTGRLFREFGITIAGAVIISSFVALTLTPMLSGRMLKRRETPLWFYRVTEPFFLWLTEGYRTALRAFMRFRWQAFPLMLLTIGLIFWVGSMLQSELAPLEDRNMFRAVATAPEGSTFEYMEEYMNELVDLIQEKVPENQGIVSVTSPGFAASSSVNSGFAFTILSPSDERDRSQSQIVEDLSGEVRKLSGARSFLVQLPTIGGSRFGLPVQYVLQAPNFEALKEQLPEFVRLANEDPTFSVIDVNLKFNKPELQLSINREKARSLGVAVEDIAQTLQLGLSGQRFGYFIMDGKQYQVIGQVDRPYRDDPFDLRTLYVRNQTGQMIQMDNLVQVREQVTPPQLFRYNRYVSATVSANLAPGRTIGDGIAAMDAIADRALDERFSTALSGDAKEFSESSSSLVYAFILAIVLIYLVLAAQFESFRDPLIIMFTVPLALAGAVIALWYFRETLNIFSQIGIIMLIGLVSKNGILIVEFANQKKAAGLSRRDAIMEASVARFRPILMTSLSTILGVLPIALALGAGSESRVSMGIAVIGGMLISTLLTLFIIPAIYTYLSEKEKQVSNLDVEAKPEAEVVA
ncbi:MAG: efflux RND transporter permease subunit [Bacteroidetes bacterium]|nr:MAG: efflux RND transporter permease subunit [Bacteroidota bacterium]